MTLSAASADEPGSSAARAHASHAAVASGTGPGPAALIAFLPQVVRPANAATEPEISADQWQTMHEAFKKELEQLPRPQTAQEQELQRKLEELAAMLKERPDKRDALKEIARLSDRVEQQRRALGNRGTSMRSAARAVAASQALRQFAAKLQEGSYKSAAGELKKLSEQLKQGKMAPDAKEFESMAADLQRLAEQLSAEQELQGECQKCSGAAGSMNKDALAEALRRLAEQMDKQSDRLGQCDKLGQYSDLLEQLKRMMNQCQGSCNKPGEGFCQNPGGTGAGKGGSKAGWGTASKWNGGSIKPASEQRTPDLASAQDRPGVSTSFQVVSPDERAQSGRRYEELYAEFVQKSEADLGLESVPPGYREYLKRYFNAIRPQETQPTETPDKSP
jgi:hypothetical protein